MHYFKTSIIALAVAITANASAQFNIYLDAYAQAYDPPSDFQSRTVSNLASWNALGRIATVNAISQKHPFDPPYNTATAMSQIQQPQFSNSTIRAKSYVLSDYSGIGSTAGYETYTTLVVNQALTVHVGGTIGQLTRAFLSVPMHGFLAGRGSPVYGGTGDAHAGMIAQAFDMAGNFIDDDAATLDLDATDFNTFTWNATGSWVGEVTETAVTYPTLTESRTSQGVELNGGTSLELGMRPGQADFTFNFSYLLETSARITSAGSKFALADLSGTGHIQVLMFDEAGNPFTDFTVEPAAVPEPAPFAVIGMGALFLVRRRKVRLAK